MSRAVAFICTLAVGGLVALQPPANAAMAKHVGDLGAAFVSVSISCATVGLILLIAGHPSRLSNLTPFRPEWALGGLAGAAVVAVTLVSVRSLGAGSVTALLVAAQLIVSVIADRYQWFGLQGQHCAGPGAYRGPGAGGRRDGPGDAVGPDRAWTGAP